MALQIFHDSNLTDLVSSDTSNPITTQHEISGATQVVQVYVSNDEATKKYESVQVEPIDLNAGTDDTWIELSLDGVTYMTAGTTLSMSNINDSGIGHDVYVRVTSEAVAETQNKSNIALRVTGTEFAV